MKILENQVRSIPNRLAIVNALPAPWRLKGYDTASAEYIWIKDTLLSKTAHYVTSGRLKENAIDIGLILALVIGSPLWIAVAVGIAVAGMLRRKAAGKKLVITYQNWTGYENWGGQYYDRHWTPQNHAIAHDLCYLGRVERTEDYEFAPLSYGWVINAWRWYLGNRWALDRLAIWYGFKLGHEGGEYRKARWTWPGRGGWICQYNTGVSICRRSWRGRGVMVSRRYS